MHTSLVILAGGASSRMKNSSANENLSEAAIIEANSKSKALIGIGDNNRPILDYLLFNAEKAGYKNIFLVIGEEADAFYEYYGKDSKRNNFSKLRLFFATQFVPEGRTKPYGTADALLQTLEQFPHLQNESFTVCNSDNLYSVDALLSLRKNQDPNAFISYNRDGLLFSMQRISRFALVLLDAENFLLDMVEKPSIDEAETYRDSNGKFRVSMNIFKLNGNYIYPFLKFCPVNVERNEKELPTAVLNLCKAHPRIVRGIPFNEHVPDLTSKEDIEVLKRYIKDQFSE